MLRAPNKSEQNAGPPQNNQMKIGAMNPENKKLPQIGRMIPENQPENKSFILIKSVETISEVSYKISESLCKIGRHSTNNIVIFDESVSRFHAQIEKTTTGFSLKDVGSTTGTFVKIDVPVELKPNMIIEIGSYQLIVRQVKTSREEQPNEQNEAEFVEFTIYESPNEVEVDRFRLKGGSSIGRKTNNSLCFNEDLHMSNLHCRVQLIGGSSGNQQRTGFFWRIWGRPTVPG